MLKVKRGLSIKDIYIDPGTVIKANYNTGTRLYTVIANYGAYVLCERKAVGGSYLKCFLKTDVIHHTIPTEEYNL